MKNIDKYTSSAVKELILADEKILQSEKEKEKKKIVLSEEIYAICSIVNDLTNSLNKLKLSIRN